MRTERRLSHTLPVPCALEAGGAGLRRAGEVSGCSRRDGVRSPACSLCPLGREAGLGAQFRRWCRRGPFLGPSDPGLSRVHPLPQGPPLQRSNSRKRLVLSWGVCGGV